MDCKFQWLLKKFVSKLQFQEEKKLF
jgi:hypothetical protein